MEVESAAREEAESVEVFEEDEDEEEDKKEQPAKGRMARRARGNFRVFFISSSFAW